MDECLQARNNLFVLLTGKSSYPRREMTADICNYSFYVHEPLWLRALDLYEFCS